MKKNLYYLFFVSLLASCGADAYKQQEYLEKIYPKHKIEPASGLIKEKGYEFIAVDSTGEIFAISFYPFSENKITSFRNIR